MSLRDESNEHLVRRVQNGDRSAFDCLIERHFGMVYALGLARLGSREAAEDLAQEVFLRVFLHVRDLRDPKLLTAWIGRMTRNLAANWVRAHQRRSQVLPLLAGPPDEVILSVTDTRKGVREQMDDQTAHEKLHQAIAALPIHQRELVLLCYMEGMSRVEIASRMGVHPSTVGRQIDRALSSLRGILEPVLRTEMAGLRATPKAVTNTLSVVAAIAVATSPLKGKLLAAEAWKTGTSAVAAASATVANLTTASVLTSKLSTYLTGGLFAMKIGKIAAIAVAAVVVGGGIYYTASSLQSPPQQRSVVPLSAPPAPPMSALPALPEGYTVKATPAKSTNRISRGPDKGRFEAEGLYLHAAVMKAWQVSPARIVNPENLNPSRIDFLLQGPPQRPESEFYSVLQVEIQRAFGVRIVPQTYTGQVLVLTAPSGQPSALSKPARTDSSFWQSQGGKSRVFNDTLEPLTSAIESETGMIVVDETGLGGKYDYEWAGDARTAAVKSLGLRIEEDQRQVDIVVVMKDPSLQTPR